MIVTEINCKFNTDSSLQFKRSVQVVYYDEWETQVQARSNVTVGFCNVYDFTTGDLIFEKEIGSGPQFEQCAIGAARVINDVRSTNVDGCVLNGSP